MEIPNKFCNDVILLSFYIKVCGFCIQDEGEKDDFEFQHDLQILNDEKMHEKVMMLCCEENELSENGNDKGLITFCTHY